MRKRVRRGLAGLAALAAIAAGWWFVVRPSLDPLAVARSAYEQGEWDKASRSAIRRLNDAPGDREALRLLARSDARAGRDPAAQTTFMRLGRENWEAEDYLLLANGLLRQGQAGAAWGSLLGGLEADPNHPEVLEQMARIAIDQGRPLYSAEFARRLASRPRWEARGGVMLADAYKRVKDPAGEAKALGQALRSDPSLAGTGTSPPEARKRRARDLLALGRPGEALRELEAVASPSGADCEAGWIRSRAFLQEGTIPEATKALAAGEGASDDPTRPEPAPFVGASTCARCHEEIHRSQRASRHTSTLTWGPGLRDYDPPSRPIPDPGFPETEHRIHREGDRLVYETQGDGGRHRASVEYILGSGGLGQTFVGSDAAGKARELRISSYSGRAAWDVTTGQELHPSHDVERLGRELNDDQIRRCLGCHSTRTVFTAGRPAPDTLDRGIGCEQCHGPGGNHLKAVEVGFPDPAIARPRLATGAQVVELCGQCHGPPPGTPPPPGPLPARSQAPGLKLSACYQKSEGTLSCVTCHDPHRDAETSPAFYEARCRSCHESGPESGAANQARGHKAPPCPVNRLDGCVGCHMPRVVGPTRHSAFADHNIRVHLGLELR